jgi:hypothetical protein
MVTEVNLIYYSELAMIPKAVQGITEIPKVVEGISTIGKVGEAAKAVEGISTAGKTLDAAKYASDYMKSADPIGNAINEGASKLGKGLGKGLGKIGGAIGGAVSTGAKNLAKGAVENGIANIASKVLSNQFSNNSNTQVKQKSAQQTNIKKAPNLTNNIKPVQIAKANKVQINKSAPMSTSTNGYNNPEPKMAKPKEIKGRDGKAI